MKPLTSHEIRKRFISFFEQHEHLKIEGAPLIPKDDPTLLFINSGMAPLKNYFLGKKTPPNKQLCNVQACIRTRDIDDVGDRHHMTLFEMLGSWSIGGYYKKQALTLAWRLLTEVLGFPKEKLYFTAYGGNKEKGIDPDHASVAAWKEAGAADDHVLMLGEDNFWGPAGETGPCGPCTEVFFDTGAEYGPAYVPGGAFDDKNRYIEIWNAGVFMELNKNSDGSFTPLPLKSVDTGSGLERMEMVMRGLHCVYDTSLLAPLITLAKDCFPSQRLNEEHYRILVDHLRASVFIVSEGVQPSNVGRGYIPRRLLRKCISIAYRASEGAIDFTPLINKIIALNGTHYPLLESQKDQIHATIHQEYNDFQPILKHGTQIIEDAVATLETDLLPTKIAFDLVTTHGFPFELVCEYLESHAKRVDEDDFHKQFNHHQEVSRRGLHRIDAKLEKILAQIAPTVFNGYQNHETAATTLAVLTNSDLPDMINEEESWIITDKTCFYGESGGQVGDRGRISGGTTHGEVRDTIRLKDRYIHKVHNSVFKSGQSVKLTIDPNHRRAVCANHSATHLLHAALQQIIGKHAVQKGSAVDGQRLRFDFSHDKSVSFAQRQQIEARVNTWIGNNSAAETRELTLEAARETGAMAIFDENYGDSVRVVRLNDDSLELCGGTHIQACGDIGLFLITSESSVAKGIRRIEAITGSAAIHYMQQQNTLLTQIQLQLSSKGDEVLKKIEKLKSDLATAQKKPKKSSDSSLEKIKETQTEKGNRLFTAFCQGDSASAKHEVDQRIANGSADIACVVAIEDGIAKVVIAVHTDKSKVFKAGVILKTVLPHIEGRGGGKPTFAQGAGRKIEGVTDLLKAIIAEA